MCNKVVNRCFLYLILFLIGITLKKCVAKLFLKIFFLIVYCPDDSLGQLILIPDCFVTSRMIKKKLFTALHADENVFYFNEDSNSIVFNCKEMGILNIDLNSINLDENFDGDNPDTTILIRLLAWHIKFEKRKEI